MQREAGVEHIAIRLGPFLSSLGLAFEAGTLALLLGTETDIREGKWTLRCSLRWSLLLIASLIGHGVRVSSLVTPYLYPSQVTYIKKLVEMGYMHHQRCEIDRRSVRVRLTQKGRDVRDVVARLFERHADGLQGRGVLGADGIDSITAVLRRVERYWADQIRYIY